VVVLFEAGKSGSGTVLEKIRAWLVGDLAERVKNLEAKNERSE
jgi:hypothetical protein